MVEIKRLLAEKEPRKVIAETFGVTTTTIGHIAGGVTWQWVEVPPQLAEGEESDLALAA